MDLITIDDFAKLDLRVATILAAEAVEGTDKLVKLTVDAGDPESRTIVAGIREFFQPDLLVGMQITIVANLAPRKMRGIESHGMLLAAKDLSGMALVRPNYNITPGTKVG